VFDRHHLPMKPGGSELPKTKLYLLLLAIQIAGVMVFIRQQLPEFEQVVVNPGKQLPHDVASDLTAAGIFCLMQLAFWYRLRRVPIPFRRQNLFIGHVFLFLGRLSFIFGSALFSVTVFRHLPELGGDTNFALTAWRGVILMACLFALFCTSLELERLGHAFESVRD
jgi:hypothetical protein